MISLKMLSLKEITTQLFMKDTFDSFCLYEASFLTLQETSLNGQRIRQYYTDEEWAGYEGEEYISWGEIRPLAYQLIKGSRLPVSFKINLKLSKASLAGFLNRQDMDIDADSVAGLFLHIRYEHEQLNCISGVSFKTFVLDKTLDRAWDKALCQFFDKKAIKYDDTANQ